jgi:hypothetical protein
LELSSIQECAKTQYGGTKERSIKTPFDFCMYEWKGNDNKDKNTMQIRWDKCGRFEAIYHWVENRLLREIIVSYKIPTKCSLKILKYYRCHFKFVMRMSKRFGEKWGDFFATL